MTLKNLKRQAVEGPTQAPHSTLANVLGRPPAPMPDQPPQGSTLAKPPAMKPSGGTAAAVQEAMATMEPVGVPEITEDANPKGDLAKVLRLGEFVCKISQEPNPENPRTTMDNVGVMVCFHKRYKLGDDGHGIRSEDYPGWEEMEKAIEAQHPGAVILPLYLMDHSGISISTQSFHDNWDSGRVGLIYATAEKIQYEWSGDAEQAKEYLGSEVETYNDYLTGNIFEYTIEDKEGNILDSLSGCYGLAYTAGEGSEALKSAYKDAMAEAVEAQKPEAREARRVKAVEALIEEEGLTIADCLSVFAKHRTVKEGVYVAAAQNLLAVEGEVEIDDNAAVSLGEDPGAYVMGWLWVSNEDAGIEDPDEGSAIDDEA